MRRVTIQIGRLINSIVQTPKSSQVERTSLPLFLRPPALFVGRRGSTRQLNSIVRCRTLAPNPRLQILKAFWYSILRKTKILLQSKFCFLFPHRDRSWWAYLFRSSPAVARSGSSLCLLLAAKNPVAVWWSALSSNVCHYSKQGNTEAHYPTLSNMLRYRVEIARLRTSRSG